LGGLSDGKLKCMNCKLPFTDDFIAEHLGTTFLAKDYRKMREQFLFDSQVAMIPDTMAFVAIVDEQKQNTTIINELQATKQQLLAQVQDINQQLQHHRDHQEQLAARLRSSSSPATTATVRSVNCVNNACNGAMSYNDGDDYMHCAACKHTACVHCHEPVSDDEAGAHVCDVETLDTIAEIMLSSRPCPGCGHAISRTEGCPMMFCTVCHTAFDYNTGEVERTNIHNPHFFEWLQSNPEAAAAFEAGNIGEYMQQQHQRGQCEPPHLGSIRDATAHMTAMQQRVVFGAHRMALHMRYEVRELQGQIGAAQDTNASNRDIRIKYILNELSDADFRRELYMREKSTNKKIACHQLYDMLATTLTDLLHRLVDDDDSMLDELANLRTYFNKASTDIAIRFKSKTITLKPDWSIV
jgi:hypothetical protein